VRTLTGRSMTITAHASDTVRQLKASLCSQERQCLVHTGHNLEDACTLHDCGIVEGSTVNLVLRLRGGGDSELTGTSLYSELTTCRRELAYRRAEVREFEAEARAEERRHERETAEMQEQIQSAVQRAHAGWEHRAEASSVVRHALRTCQEELGELHVEVAASKAQVEPDARTGGACGGAAEAGGGGRRDEWQEVEGLKAALQESQHRGRGLRDERGALEAALARLRPEAEESAVACQQEHAELAEREESLAAREETVAEYHERAHDLHQELHHVLQQLRTSHESALREHRRLVTHVAALEREAAAPPLTGEGPWRFEAQTISTASGCSSSQAASLLGGGDLTPTFLAPQAAGPSAPPAPAADAQASRRRLFPREPFAAAAAAPGRAVADLPAAPPAAGVSPSAQYWLSDAWLAK